MTNPRTALARLMEAASSGRLDELCERHHVRIMTAFGSAADPDAEDPHDLDIAVAFEPEHRGDVIALWADLQDLCGPVELDIMDLDQARPVGRAHSLVGIPLYEHAPDEFARDQAAALLGLMDTAWLRRINLDVLAS